MNKSLFERKKKCYLDLSTKKATKARMMSRMGMMEARTSTAVLSGSVWMGCDQFVSENWSLMV